MAEGVISAEELMRNLANARKVMNKVETGSYQKGNINKEVLYSDPLDLINEGASAPPPQNLRSVASENVDVDKINKSKLPDAIKKIMIEKPIQQISLNSTLNMDIVKGAKRLMEQEGILPEESVAINRRAEQSSTNYNTNDLAQTLTPIIESVIRRVLDEKLTQILNAQHSTALNENLVIKVGDKIFGGKITGVKNSN